MIKENQKTLNYINIILDALILFISMPVSFWTRFHLFNNGIITVPLESYIKLVLILIPIHLAILATMGLYESLRNKSLHWELWRLLLACILDFILIQTVLFLYKEIHFSRGTLILFFVISFIASSGKRIILRLFLRYMRSKGYNLKHVVLVGDSEIALEYVEKITTQKDFGYTIDGYVADKPFIANILYYGKIDNLSRIVSKNHTDEVVAALSPEQVLYTKDIINICEKEGVKLSLIPFYAEYMPSNPEFDNIDGIPLMNIRHIPLDNWLNAALKRMVDIIGSLILIIVTSPIMLFAAIGVKLSSPGPIIFAQERVGLNKNKFKMYKFRSMRVNNTQTTGWSTNKDPRKTKFGAFIRKCSIDELPQFFNVLKGDMSLVGPRPELPHFVDKFKEEIPLYMVKHQVRPGITGWAQVNGFRGDTSIEGRIKCDIYYIENWNFFFDIKILFMTAFGGMFNKEKLS